MRIFIVMIVLCGAGVAGADEREGHRLKERGMRHYQQGRYTQAAREFRAAHALAPDPELLYALGQALRLAGDCPGAIGAYQEFLDTSPRSPQAHAAREKIAVCGGVADPDPAEPGPGAQLALEAPGPEVAAPPPSSAPERPDGRRPWYRDRLGGALTAGGVVSLALGTWLVLDARGDLVAVDRADTEEEFLAAQERAEGAQLRRALGLTAMAAGVGLVAGGVVRYILLRRDERERAPVIGAVVDGDRAGLVLSGVF